VDSGERLARAIATKDRQALLDVLHPEVDFRGLTPNRTWEAGDAEALVEIVLAEWFEPKDEVEELVSVASGQMVDRQTVTYRLRGENPDGPFLVEQTAYLTESGGRIDWLRVMCSGFRPDS
jgi:hypothetical protein